MKPRGLIILLMCCFVSVHGITPEQVEFFETKIRPVLVESCYDCHNSVNKTKAGLALDWRDALLAGSEDHYMPLAHFHRQARALTQVRSFTGRIFTRAESAQTHCQCGNLGLALQVMLDWIDERTASRA